MRRAVSFVLPHASPPAVPLPNGSEHYRHNYRCRNRPIRYPRNPSTLHA